MIFKTTGKALRAVTGWDMIDFVADDDEVCVRTVASSVLSVAYATWVNDRGGVDILGYLIEDAVEELEKAQ